jgi:hypothetical protein
MLQAIKQYRYLIIIPIFIIISVSCKKSFLDVENNTQLYRQSYVKDMNTMEQFKNGIYVMLNYDYANGIGASYPELAADNLKPLPSGTQALISHYSWTQQATDKQETTASESSTSMNGIWSTGYLIIRSCNFVIEDVNKYREEDPAKADDMKAQALAIRALVHFRLVNTFAQSYNFSSDGSHIGIPYITTSDITKHFSRQTVAEVYDAMISDLDNAIQLMPVEVTDTRFMNQAAAKALLARIYLFKGDYNNAKTLATEICNQFPLLTIANGYPNNLFVNKLPVQSEILYRLTPVTQPGVTSVFLGARLRGATLLFTATDDIAKILTENSNDIRRNWVQNVSGLWNVLKYPQGVTPELNLTVSLPQIAYYHPVIRSSEMFLTVAEASAKSGDENTARTYLDAIRKRANPSIASISATGQSLIDSIYKERRKELCFEELRFYDLLRWKLGVHREDVLTGMPKDLSFPNNKAVSPIHIQDVNVEGLTQNEGYY